MRRGIDRLKLLAAFLLLAFLPAIAAAKDSHPSSSHPKPTHVTNSHKVPKHHAADHSSLKNVRSASAKRNFQASNPCPATGKTTGSCKGYVIDHKDASSLRRRGLFREHAVADFVRGETEGPNRARRLPVTRAMPDGQRAEEAGKEG
jgi:hypothetical protein